MFSGSYLRWKEAHEFYIKAKYANCPLLIDFYRGVNGVALMKKNKFLFNHSWTLKKIIRIHHQCTACHTCHFEADNTHVLIFSMYLQIPVYFISGVSDYELYVLMRSGFLGPSFNLPSSNSAFFFVFYMWLYNNASSLRVCQIW